MNYDKSDIVNVATKLGRLANGGVIGYYTGGKTSEIMSNAIPKKLIDTVETHKKYQLGASLAQSFIPGAGVAASAVAVASLWKMYYDINQVLGIKISENAGKSLTSAVVTNLSAFAVKGVATAVSEGAKIIPFVGWIASAAISTATTTALIYGSAYLYMNSLVAMYSALGKFDFDYLSNNLLESSQTGGEYDYDDDDDEGLSEIHEVINIIADELDVDADDISPNSNLKDDLGATNLNKINILVALKEWSMTDSNKSIDDFTFVDDFIEEFTGESLWNEDIPPLIEDDEDDDDFSYQNEYARFESFEDSYLDDEYSNMKIEDLSNMLISEADRSEYSDISSHYYRLLAVAKLEYFYKEWLENHFSNYTGQTKKAELLRICLIEGIENIEKARELLDEDNTECVFVYLALSMLKDFWVDECVDKKRYEQDYGTDAISFCDEKEAFMFCTDWLKRMYMECYEAIIGSLAETYEDTLSEAEQEYLNELKEILSDGEITPRERRLLDKIRIKLEISESRASELEESLSNLVLTPEEQEYLDEYREIVADGEISARDQRFLDKLKKTNGISESRAKELEALA